MRSDPEWDEVMRREAEAARPTAITDPVVRANIEAARITMPVELAMQLLIRRADARLTFEARRKPE